MKTLHETPQSEPEHLAELVTRVSWRLRKGRKEELTALGLTFAQSRALQIIAKSDTPLRMSDLASRLEIVPRSATTTVDLLETANLIERQGDPQDRRSTLLLATHDGHALLTRMSQQRRESATALFGKLNEHERQSFSEILEKLCGNEITACETKRSNPQPNTTSEGEE